MRYLWITAILIITAACGQSEQHSGTELKNQLVARFRVLDAVKQIQNDDVKCALNDCPDYVAKLAIADKSNTQVLVCTAFLISDDIVMTNGHCIPEYLKKDVSSCTDRIGVTFPKNKRFQKERFVCAKVLSSSYHHLELDYSFIKLTKNTKRVPLEIDNKSGFVDHEQVEVWSMDPMHSNSKRFFGLIKRQTCNIFYNSFITPNFNHKNYPYVFLGDCSIRGGNSGSPLISVISGKAKGILNVRYPHSTISKILKGHGYDPNVILPFKLGALAGGNNFTCMDFPAEVSTYTNPLCDEREIYAKHTQLKKDWIKILLDNLKLKTISDWNKRSNHLTVWQVYTKAGRENFTVKPKCIKKVEALTEGPNTLGNITIPAWTLNKRFDPYGRLLQKVHLETTQGTLTIQKTAVNDKPFDISLLIHSFTDNFNVGYCDNI
ncbi:MAG: trypsin-like peptidase domain-containing protein [Bacteriovoracaceae bacterium]|nr:trypsin-like peptidase domain-containing protein [Bacteriovoracaceae bacterium]